MFSFNMFPFKSTDFCEEGNENSFFSMEVPGFPFPQMPMFPDFSEMLFPKVETGEFQLEQEPKLPDFQDPTSLVPQHLESFNSWQDTEKLQVAPHSDFLPKPVVPLPGNKKIGTISLQERKVKIQRFLEKRKRRSFTKKVNYQCRKRVADTRVRVRGRFITKAEAAALERSEQRN